MKKWIIDALWIQINLFVSAFASSFSLSMWLHRNKFNKQAYVIDNSKSSQVHRLAAFTSTIGKFKCFGGLLVRQV